MEGGEELPWGGDSSDEGSLLEALRGIGQEGQRGATFDPLTQRAAAEAETPSGPVLWQDNGDVLWAAKAARSAKVGAGASGSAKVGAKASRAGAAQLDLNDPEHLADLEDPGLRAHMDKARSQLRGCEREQDELRSPEELAREDGTARRALSALVTSLKERQMALRCTCDEVILAAENAGKLASGDQPHGYPSVGAPREAFGVLLSGLEAGREPGALLPAFTKALDRAHAAQYRALQKKLAGSGSELEELIAQFEEFERGLTLARRHYETVADGLRRRCEFYEGLLLQRFSADFAKGPAKGPAKGSE